MKRIGIFTLGAVAMLLGACDWVGIRGNGQVVTDQRPITDFTEIDSSGGLRIEWHSGPPSLSITTDKNLLHYIDSSVSGNVLRFRVRESVRPTHSIKISASSPKLNGADFRGAVDFTAKDVAGPKFYVRASGASDITLAGNVTDFLCDLTGASELRAREFQTATTEIVSTGASSAKISVSEALRVSITGAGDVSYYGNPKTVEKHVTGAGSIHHKD